LAHRMAVDAHFDADAGEHAIVPTARIHAGNVVALDKPPATGGTGERDVELAAHHGGGAVVITGIADVASQTFRLVAIDLVLVQRKALTDTEQEIDACARDALCFLTPRSC
jgi:hypothetical protein